MKQHFITIQQNQAKNRAHVEIQEFAAKYVNCLIDDLKLDGLIDLLKKEIRAINDKYTRCQDINWGTSPVNDGHFVFFIEGNFYMSITEVKRFELSIPECKHHYTDYDGTSEYARCKSCGERVKVNVWKESGK